jgi:hypothetical protein
MRLSASELRVPTDVKIKIARCATAVIETIQYDIESAHARGQDKVSVKIPGIFEVQVGKNDQWRFFVYSAIIRELEENGYIVRIDVSTSMDTDTMLYIAWSGGGIGEDVQTVLKYIRDHDVKNIKSSTVSSTPVRRRQIQ